MGSISAPEIPALTPLERIGPKGFLQYVFPFELPEDYDPEQITSILKTGYKAASQRLPVLACEAVPDPAAKQAGVMKLQHIDDSEVEAIVAKDLSKSGLLPSFSELKAKSFPVSAFDTDVLMRRHVWASPEERLRVSQIQANFIEGGLILGWSIFHMFGDGTTFFVWTQVWAEECRRAQNLSSPKPLDLPSAIFTDRERLMMKPSGDHAGAFEDHPEYTLLPFTPPGAPPKMLSTDHRGQVFYFSREALQALKEEASPSKATQPSEQTWISTNDALSALLWRTVMAVQNPVESLPADGDPQSVFNIAIDARLRTDPPVHPQTLGCFLAYVSAVLPIRAMLSDYSLADIALRVRQAVLSARPGFTEDVAALIDRVSDVDRLVAKAFLDVPGFNCVQSSWAGFALYDLDWGLLGKIQAVRSPSLGVINGLQVIFPVLPDGGLEVLVGVEQNCLDKLLHEPLWNKFAKAR